MEEVWRQAGPGWGEVGVAATIPFLVGSGSGGCVVDEELGSDWVDGCFPHLIFNLPDVASAG